MQPRTPLALLSLSVAASLSTAALAQTHSWLPAPVLEARSGQVAAFDSARGSIVMFGGFQTARYDETWEWDGVAWNMLRPNTRPPGRRDHNLCYDSTRDRIVMFGGNGVTGGLADTWEWDGSDWTQRFPANAPSPRDGCGMGFDAARGTTVLFGGQSPLQSDTWLWNGSQWTQAAPATNPGGHALTAMSYDSARQKLVMFGGTTTLGNANDTWEWDGTDWQQVLTPNLPPVRQRHSLTFDSTRGKTLLFGGSAGTTRFQEVWEYDGTDWTMVPTPAVAPIVRDRVAFAFDPVHQETILFGGRGPTNSNNLADTWTWNGTAWTQLDVTLQPTARANAAVAYDDLHQLTLLFGGAATAGTQQDTWAWNGAQWQTFPSANQPPARSFAALCFDSTRGRAVLFGGLDTNGNDLDDTWEWDGSSWLQTVSALNPPARSHHALAFDSTRGKTVLYGGLLGLAGAALDDTWEWDGSLWLPASPLTPPPARTDHVLAFDRARGRTVLFGGASLQPAATLGDTWEWDGVQWMQASPATSPTARTNASFGHDTVRGRCVLFGGTDAGAALLADSWEWDGAVWNQTATTGPTARTGAGMAYDALRHRHVLIGGRTGAALTNNGETWEYSVPGTADVVPFGAGCAGSLGVPSLSTGSIPSIGNASFGLLLGNLPPSSFSLLAIGFARERSELGSGCTLFLPAALAVTAVVANGSGSAAYAMPLPNATWLLGVRTFAQGAGIDPTGPYLGMVTFTRGLDLRIGL
jgi:hypothetical protein